MAPTDNVNERPETETERTDAGAPELDAEEILGVVSSIEARLEEVRRLHEEQEHARAEIEQREREAAERERALAERAQRIASLTQELETRRAALDAEREHALAELEQLRCELAEARAEPAPTADGTDDPNDPADEARCNELEEECERLRKRIEEMREDPYRARAEQAELEASQRAAAARRSAVFRAIAIALVWVTVSGLVAVAGWAGLMHGSPEQGAIALGLAFAAAFFGSLAVAGRLLDPPALAVGGLGASFGLWFPAWIEAIETAIRTWSLPIGGLPDPLVALLPVGVGVATVSITMAIALFALTGRGTILVITGFGALAASLLAVMPDRTGVTLFGASVLWTALVATALTRWAVAARCGRHPSVDSTRSESLGRPLT